MKTLLNYSTLLLLLLMASCSSLKTTPEYMQEITQKVHSKDFTVVVKYANPMRGRQIYLNSEYDLRIKNDSAFAFLPYFGVAYTVPYGGDSGIKFAEPMTNYTLSNNKKGNGWDVHFKIKSNDSDYEIIMNIFNTGSSTFTVDSINKDAITFSGDLKK